MTLHQEEAEGKDELVVFKCAACGDVFPAHEQQDAICRSCGSSDVHRAHEPLL